jgi:propionate CoA-transferase
MDYWMGQLSLSGRRAGKESQLSHRLIGARAAKELKPENTVNIGIGIPENVSRAASSLGVLNSITMTVESGGIGGLPAPGIDFGAVIGADFISDMSQPFDFYDGGGLDICFMGALEVDGHGNVNSHRLPGIMPGIGGFMNITHTTKKVVFCLNFSTVGLIVANSGNSVKIISDGKIGKFVKAVSSISFNAKTAVEKGQDILYVTERCVFRLTDNGLKLIEVADGIDITKDITDLLPFDIETTDSIGVMDFSL